MKHKLLSELEYYIPAEISGLSMEKGEIKEGVQTYNFTHSNNYKVIHQKYLYCVQTHNPNNIGMLIQEYPFHIESLFRLSEYFKSTGDFKSASDLVERVLYVCETCSHAQFDWLGGNSRVDFDKEENKTLFLALFRQIEYFGRRGLCRTALEFCKGKKIFLFYFLKIFFYIFFFLQFY